MFKVIDEVATNAEISSTVKGKKFGHSFREEIKMDIKSTNIEHSSVNNCCNKVEQVKLGRDYPHFSK